MVAFNIDLLCIVVGVFALVRLQASLQIVPRLLHGLKLIVPKQFGFSQHIASDRSIDISMEEIFTYFNMTMIQINKSSKISQQVLKLQSYYSSLNIFLQIFLLATVSQIIMNLWSFLIPPTIPTYINTIWYTLFTFLAYLLSVQLVMQILFHSVIKYYYDVELRMSIIPAALLFLAGMVYTQVFQRHLLPLTTLSDLSQHLLTLMKYFNPQIERVFPIPTMNYLLELSFLVIVCVHCMLYVVPGFRRGLTLVKMTLGKSFERVKDPLQMFSLWAEYVMSLFLVLFFHPIIIQKMLEGLAPYYHTTVLSLPLLSDTIMANPLCPSTAESVQNVTVTFPITPTASSESGASSASLMASWSGLLFTTPMDIVITIQLAVLMVWCLFRYCNTTSHWQSYLDFSIETVSLMIMNNSPAATRLAKAQKEREASEAEEEGDEGQGKREESAEEIEAERQALRERMQLQQILQYTIESRSGNLIVVISQSIAFTLSIVLIAFVLFRHSTIGLGLSVYVQRYTLTILQSLSIPMHPVDYTQRGIAKILENGYIAYRSTNPSDILSAGLKATAALDSAANSDSAGTGTCSAEGITHTIWTLLYNHYAFPLEATQSVCQHLLEYIFIFHLAVNFLSLLLWLIYPQVLKNTISSPRRLV